MSTAAAFTISAFLASGQCVGGLESTVRSIASEQNADQTSLGCVPLRKIVPTVAFIACHAGPADQFATFFEELVKKGYQVQIYATGPALKKFQDRHIEKITPFSLENSSEAAVAVEVAKLCAEANVVITDVGHIFDGLFQEALSERTPEIVRCAYYDNPEVLVPGGYSVVAAKVMRVAQRVLFANANLAKEPIYEAPLQEVMLVPERRIGLGYYPIDQAEQIAKRRVSEQKELRSQLFSIYDLEDQRQPVLFYAGGNNEEYFEKAFPAFLDFLAEASLLSDLSKAIIVLQQHPGAVRENRDNERVQQWKKREGSDRFPQFFISNWKSNDAQVMADGMFYYQTSMGPQFVLAGIPTIQVGHVKYEDILVKNELCSVVNDAHTLLDTIKSLHPGVKREVDHEMVKQKLGIRSEWLDNLERAIQEKV